MSKQEFMLRRKLVKKACVQSEFEHPIIVSDDLFKQAVERGETLVESEVRIIEPLFTEFKLEHVESSLKPRLFGIKVSEAISSEVYKVFSTVAFKRFLLRVESESLRGIEVDCIIPVKHRRYLVNIEAREFGNLRVFSVTSSLIRYRLNDPCFSKVEVYGTVASGRKYLFQEVLFMKQKISTTASNEIVEQIVRLGSNLEYEMLRIIDLENLLLGDACIKGIWFGGSKYLGEPIVFVVNDDLWYLVAELCKEFYRETRGELPRPHIVVVQDKSDIEEFEDLMRTEKVDKRIMVVRFLRDNVEECIRSPRFAKVMRRVLNELFSQGLGFLIVTADFRNTGVIDELSNKIAIEYREFYEPRIIKIKSLQAETIPVIEKHVALVYGFERFKHHVSERLLRIIGYRIAEAERLYKDFIDETLRLNKYLYKVKLHRVEDKKESEDHLAIKALVVKNLVEQHGVDLNNIETEFQVESGAIADVYVKDKGWVIEVETLFGTGAAPILKIRDTVLKYKDNPNVRRIWVVIRNMPVLVHFRNLLRLMRYLREEMKNKEIEFYTVNVSKGTLTSLLEIRKQIIKQINSITREKHRVTQEELEVGERGRNNTCESS